MMARSQGISRIICLCLSLIGVLTACGGRGASQDDSIAYISPSPTPTTPLEERINHQLGTAENPYIMLIKPVGWIDDQIPTLLEGLGFDAVTSETNLREGDTLRDDLADLQIAIETTFGVRLLTYELEQVQTVADLDGFIKQRVMAEVTRTIFDRTRLYIDVQFMDYYGQGVHQLCRVEDGLVRMAWLDGLSYFAAVEQGCGDGEMMLMRGDDRDLFADVAFDLSVLEAPNPDETTAEGVVESPFNPPTLQSQNLKVGDSAVLVLDGRLGATNPNVLETRTFCQLADGVDFYSVFLANLTLEQENVTPANIRQMSDVESLLQAVASGDCTGAMVSRQDYDHYRNEDWFENLTISRETPIFPFGILTYPLEVEIGVRLSLNANLMELASDQEDGWYLRLLLGNDSIRELDSAIYNRMQRFARDLGYDFAQLGN